MIALLLTLALFGLIVYLIVTYIPMPSAFRTAIIVIAVVLLILFMMRLFGFQDIAVPRLR